MLKKLAQAKVDTSQLRSSKNLGTKRDSRSEVALQGNKAIPLEGCLESYSDLDDDKNTGDEGSSDSEESRPTTVANGPSREKNKQNIALGSGLKRPLHLDADGKPVIAKRRKIGTLPSFIHTNKPTGPLRPLVSSLTCFSNPDEGSTPEESSTDTDGEDKETDSSSSENSDDDSASTSSAHEEAAELEEGKSNECLSAFKAWADQRKNEAAGFQPTIAIQSDVTTAPINPPAPSIQPRKSDEDPLPAELEIRSSDRKAFSVQVERDPDISSRRLALPVVAEEQKIMEAIHHNPVLVICGATGSGKTTQIPQFLFESGYGNPNSQNPGMIGITQPRRVAAVSMAKRVATELGKDGDRVAYKVRLLQ